MHRLRSLLALAFLCGACTPSIPAVPSGVATSPPPAQATSKSQTTSAAPARPIATPGAQETPPPLADDLKGLAASNNAFALDLFAKVRTRKGNLALSPLSLSTALTMTWVGARGETAAQMQKVLHLAGTTEQELDRAGKLVASYQDPGLKVTLRLANRLFGDKTYTFNQTYVDRTGSAFGAPLELLDFSHAPEASRQHINAWTAEATQDRIRDLLPSGSLDTNTRLVLVNTIYFLGDWTLPFRKELTVEAPFHVTASESKDVPTMRQAPRFRFAATDGVKLLEMPYQGGALVMTLVLPDQVDGLNAVETRLSMATLDRWIGALAPDRVDVALPKFEVNPADSLPLDDTLQTLGMPLAFSPKADFTALANAREKRIYITDVFHKAFVKLDEKGTEAAAASTVVLGGRSSGPPKPKVEFHADHPFLFFLRDVRSGMILFMGRVNDPTAK